MLVAHPPCNNTYDRHGSCEALTRAARKIRLGSHASRQTECENRIAILMPMDFGRSKRPDSSSQPSGARNRALTRQVLRLPLAIRSIRSAAS
jgi:hypothetical protein